MEKSPEPVEKSDSEASDILVEEVEEEQTTKTDSGTDKNEEPSTDDPKADKKTKIILRAVRLYPLLMKDLSCSDVQEMMALSCKCHVHFYRANDEEKLGRLDLLYSQFEDSELAASTLNDLVTANAVQRDLIPSLLKPTKESYEAGYKPQKASDEELDPKSLVKSGDPRSIYINSVPPGVTSEQLLILFPTATRAHIPIDEHGKSKGIAVVRFKKGSTAKEFYEKTKTVTIEDQELPLYRFSRGQRPAEKATGKKRSPKKKSPTKQVVSKAKHSNYGGRNFGIQNRSRVPGRGDNMGLLGVAPNYNYLNFQECLQNELQHHMQEMRHDMQLQLHMETQRMRNAHMHRQYEQERHQQQLDNQKVANQKKQQLKNKTTPPPRPAQTTPRRRQDMAGDRSYSNWADYYEGYGPGQSSIGQYAGYSRGMYPSQEYEYMPAGIHDASRWNNNNRQQRDNKTRQRGGGVYNNMPQSFYNYNGGF